VAALFVREMVISMEDTLQPLEAVQIKPNKYLILGIAVSVILHLVCAFLMLGLPSGSPAPSPLVTYIDLNAALRPAPVTVPPKAVPPVAMTPPEAAPKPQPPPPPEIPPQAKQPEALSPQPAAAAAARETRVEEPRSHTTMGLGLTKGYFKSLGEGETLREGVKQYYLEMLQVINEKWWMDQQIDKRRLAPIVVTITIARNGAITDSMILRGSGNSRYDKAVLAAIAAASPLPPLPANFDRDTFQAPIRLVPPLNLMAW